jgi:hypothetical protein
MHLRFPQSTCMYNVFIKCTTQMLSKVSQSTKHMCESLTHLKKYATRPGPPYPANLCPGGMWQRGNDGLLYENRSSGKPGILRWFKLPDMLQLAARKKRASDPIDSGFAENTHPEENPCCRKETNTCHTKAFCEKENHRDTQKSEGNPQETSGAQKNAPAETKKVEGSKKNARVSTASKLQGANVCT